MKIAAVTWAGDQAPFFISVSVTAPTHLVMRVGVRFRSQDLPYDCNVEG